MYSVTAGAGWLDLLLADASAEQLDEYRRQLATADVAAEIVEAEARQALQLQALLRDRGRRAAELSSLVDIATRLMSVRDLPELLTDIARQARQLLRCDVTYLALVEADELLIRYFDGTFNPDASDVRLSLTAGLAGRIVQTGQAAWTSRYLDDATIVHSDSADRLAADEQLRSILGVPLHAQGRTLGVLFAAERTERPFADNEIALLSGLGACAAVAIESVRLLETERAFSAEQRSQTSSVTRAIALHERLTDAAVRGGGPAGVVEALADVLAAPVQLVDSGGNSLAGPDLATDEVRERLPELGDRTLVLEPAGDDGGGFIVLSPVVATEDALGCLVVGFDGPADDAGIRLVERGALAIALSLIQQRAVADAAARSQRELLAALIDGVADERTLLTGPAGVSGVDLRRPHVVAVTDSTAAVVRDRCLDLARRQHGLAGERLGQAVLLLPHPADLSALDGLATVAVSEPADEPAGFPAAYDDARRCLAAMLALGRRDVAGDVASLGVFRFVLAPGGPDEAARLVERTLGPLLRHDAAKGTDLAATLETYLATGRQHGITAEALHIHPNTLYQRLARIGEILGQDWRDADAALELHLALRLNRIMRALV